MYQDPNGIVSRWHQAARRGTLANIVWSFAGLTLVAYIMSVTLG